MKLKYPFRHYVFSTLAFICFIAFFYYLTEVRRPSCMSWKKMKALEFEGVVTKCYYRKCSKIDIDTNGGIYTLSPAKHELFEYVNVKDTIIKLKGQNLCIIKKGGAIDTFLFEYDSSGCDTLLPPPLS